MPDLQQQLLEDLRRLGVRPGGALLVHSSLRSVGAFPDRADIVIGALQEAVGWQGALLMPTLSYETVGVDQPYFDVETTPSCVGALPEIFRKKAGVLRSAHPTHSVCGWGEKAPSLLSSHHEDTTPCGRNSPFFKLREMQGQILFIGCGLRPNTSMHAVEELVRPIYLFAGLSDFYLTLPGGEQKVMRMRRHFFAGWEQRYDRLGKVLTGDALRKGRLLAATGYLVEAEKMWEEALRIMRRDPLYFVDQV